MSGQNHTWKQWFKGKFPRRKSAIKVKIDTLRHQVGELSKQVSETKILAAQSLIRELFLHKEPLPLARTEFKVFSQFGDDGIIQYILQKLDLPPSERRFVEFGVENYTEANTRFLLINDNWSGLVMDGSEEYVSYIKRDEIYWRHDLTALARFITRDNINTLLQETGFHGRIGLLSIDIDGNDYWVWEAITVVDPALVIVEFNGLFGACEAVTIPYQADFQRTKAHSSNLYWGTSLAALCHLATQKDYVWIGCNSAGNNAYFVRKTVSSRFLCPKLPDGFVVAKLREARGPDGKLTYLDQRTGFDLVKHLPVWDVVQNRQRQLSDLNLD